MAKKPIVLIIRDGYGINPRKEGNAVLLAKTPNTDRLMKEYPFTTVHPQGESVGLPKGSQGNSEVGHLTIGSGRVLYQSQVRIDNMIEDGSFFKNEKLVNAVLNAKKHNSALHLMGLVQDQGVHAMNTHLYALLKLASMHKLPNVYIHYFGDGRDTPPKSTIKFAQELEAKMKEFNTGKIVTIMGRYYSMDRDNRWERVEAAYKAIVHGNGLHSKNVFDAIDEAYTREETDEFIKPTIIGDYKGFKENDSVIFFNYRLDRTRELTKAIVEPDFNSFFAKHPKVLYTCMTNYYDGVANHSQVALDEISTANNLGNMISRAGLKQLRISETEKYAHVTFFFNSQSEEPNSGEDRALIPSPKVPTYDLQPEMSAFLVRDRLLQELDKDLYDLVVVNIVNGDMVGHTGKLDATIKAVEAVDNCVGAYAKKILEKDGIAIIFADHGNCEQKINYETGEPSTAHTTNDVYLILVSNDPKLKNAKLKQGITLADIAPTVLDLLKIDKPKEMTGQNFIIGYKR